jgi:predicted hydrocarbon binding protein
LIVFGEFWLLNTSVKKYGAMIASGGANLQDFIKNLPTFHNRVSLIYPNLTPPEFKVTDVTQGSLRLHYYSKREGLEDFVRGLLQGLSKMFNEPISIDMVRSRATGDEHGEFIITWIK